MTRKIANPLHEEFAEKIIEDLRCGVAPGHRWPGEVFPPRIRFPALVYSGINRVMLSGITSISRADDATAGQHPGLSRPQGEKAETIVYWQFSKEEAARDDDGSQSWTARQTVSWRRSS